MEEYPEKKSHQKRLAQYAQLSSRLSCFSSSELIDILVAAPKINIGVGGTSVSFKIDGIEVFAKMVPLTALEQSKENLYSTQNMFDLPLYYQYGVGSTGYGVWRDLASHIICSNWVLGNQCQHFPLLYHDRIMPAPEGILDISNFQSLKEHVNYWENNSAIKKRYCAIHDVTAMVVLFLEYIPQTLYTYINTILESNDDELEQKISILLEQLFSTTQFMAHHGTVHFDAHFENILTDGKQVYFSDHGLSLSSQFNLSKNERIFLEQHKKLDPCFIMLNMMHTLTSSYVKQEEWAQSVECVLSKNIFPLFVQHYIDKYGEVAVILDKFYRALQHQSKTTPFPKQQLEKALAGIYNVGEY